MCHRFQGTLGAALTASALLTVVFALPAVAQFGAMNNLGNAVSGAMNNAGNQINNSSSPAPSPAPATTGDGYARQAAMRHGPAHRTAVHHRIRHHRRHH
ncbi:MAG: hypothetical protein ACLQVD_14445 [Capsulimonadaceae bacterium]